MNLYEVLYYNGWIDPPAYFLIDSAEGDTPEQALMENLNRVIPQVRKMFSVDESDMSDETLLENLYVLRHNSLVSVYSIDREKRLGA